MSVLRLCERYIQRFENHPGNIEAFADKVLQYYRDMLLFFKDKTSVFFSFMAVFVVDVYKRQSLAYASGESP